MPRNAKLYLLSNKDWKQLADNIDTHSDYTLKNDIAIFQLYSPSGEGREYAVLSISDKADDVIENYGATLATEINMIRYSLHQNHREPLYGDKSIISLLGKVP